MGGVEKLILKLTSASTGVGVEARAELGKNSLCTSLLSHFCPNVPVLSFDPPPSQLS